MCGGCSINNTKMFYHLQDTFYFIPSCFEQGPRQSPYLMLHNPNFGVSTVTTSLYQNHFAFKGN